jgi:hypothetical protein
MGIWTIDFLIRAVKGTTYGYWLEAPSGDGSLM